MCCWGVTYGNVTQDGEEDVDEEVGVAATLEEDTERGNEDGEGDLAEVGGGDGHGGVGLCGGWLVVVWCCVVKCGVI